MEPHMQPSHLGCSNKALLQTGKGRGNCQHQAQCRQMLGHFPAVLPALPVP